MCIIIDVNNKGCNVYVFCAMDARWYDFVVGIFLTNLGVSDVFLSNQTFYPIVLYYINFHSFYNVFAPDSIKISSVLNSRLLGSRWLARLILYLSTIDLFVFSYPIQSLIFFYLMLNHNSV